MRLGSPTGTTVGTFNFTSTGDWGTYQERTITLTGASDTQDVYLLGGSGTLNLDWVRFSNSTSARFAGGGNESVPGAGAVYPNPARSVLCIRLQPGARRVGLADVLGRHVLAEAATPEGGGEMKLDVSRVGKGTYLLTVVRDGGRQVKKVAIVR